MKVCPKCGTQNVPTPGYMEGFGYREYTVCYKCGTDLDFWR